MHLASLFDPRAWNKRLKGALTLVLCAGSLLAVPSKPPSISDRVTAVRSALSDKEVRRQLGVDLNTPKTQDEKPLLAQWINWGKWNNWRNWANWANWVNWRNF